VGERVEEAPRLVERDHFAAGRDDAREIERGEAGAAADVEHRVACSDAGALPRRVRVGAPQLVLEREPRDLVVVRAEHVVGGGHRGRSCTERAAVLADSGPRGDRGVSRWLA
jgi:hypothetical protein